jgi:hypothetical protein
MISPVLKKASRRRKQARRWRLSAAKSCLIRFPAIVPLFKTRLKRIEQCELPFQALRVSISCRHHRFAINWQPVPAWAARHAAGRADEFQPEIRAFRH